MYTYTVVLYIFIHIMYNVVLHIEYTHTNKYCYQALKVLYYLYFCNLGISVFRKWNVYVHLSVMNVIYIQPSCQDFHGWCDISYGGYK